MTAATERTMTASTIPFSFYLIHMFVNPFMISFSFVSTTTMVPAAIKAETTETISTAFEVSPVCGPFICPLDEFSVLAFLHLGCLPLQDHLALLAMPLLQHRYLTASHLHYL